MKMKIRIVRRLTRYRSDVTGQNIVVVIDVLVSMGSITICKGGATNMLI